MNILLWIIQVLLALTFLMSGGMKLLIPLEELYKNGPPGQFLFPKWFMNFIGVCEVLGALGLILPGIFRRQQFLTSIAAVGLTIIMIGAVVITAVGPGAKYSIPPLITGLLCAFVAYSRWKVRPLQYSFN